MLSWDPLMTGEELFRANVVLVERVIASVCRRAGLRDEEAEDFASTAKLELIENDYAIPEGYEGRAPRYANDVVGGGRAKCYFDIFR